MWRVSYIGRFISALVELLGLVHNLFRRTHQLSGMRSTKLPLKSWMTSSVIFDHDLTRQELASRRLLNFHWQSYQRTSIIGSRRGWAPCVLLEQVFPRSRVKLPFPRAPLPHTYICYSEAQPLSIGLLTQVCHQVQPIKVPYFSINYVRMHCSVAPSANRVRHHLWHS